MGTLNIPQVLGTGGWSLRRFKSSMKSSHGGGAAGTEHFMSPEQLRKESMGPSTDIWGGALG